MPSRNQRPGRKQRNKNTSKATAVGDENAFLPQSPFVPPYMLPPPWALNGKFGPATATGNTGRTNFLPLMPGFAHYEPLHSNSYSYSHGYPGDTVHRYPARQYQNNTTPLRQPVAIANQNYNSLAGHHRMGPYGPSLRNLPMPAPSSQDSVYLQMASSSLSDIERLRKLKETILCGQHPFFTANPAPDALAKLYLGPHPLSQAYQDLAPTEQQIPTEPSEKTITSQTLVKSPSTDHKLVSDNLSTVSQDISEPSLPATAVSQAANNGILDRNTQDISQPAVSHASGSFVLADMQKDTLSHVPSQAQAVSIQAESMSVDEPQPVRKDSSGSQAYKDSRIDSSSRDYENERDRERPGYSVSEHGPPRSDSYRYSQHSDRRDYGRYNNSRHPDWRYDRDHRDWDRDREKGRPGDKYAHERHLPHKFSAGIERRTSFSGSSFSATNVERRNSDTTGDRGLRSEVPPHLEQRSFIRNVVPPLDQRTPTEVPSHLEPRRSEVQPPLGPRRASSTSQRPDQRQDSFPYPADHRRREPPPGAEHKRPSYNTLPQHNGRRAPLPYTDLHPPHSDMGSLDTEIARPPSRPSQPQPEPVRPTTSVPDQRPPPRTLEGQFQKPIADEPIPHLYAGNASRDSYRRDQASVTTTQTTTERTDKLGLDVNAPVTEGRHVLPAKPESKPPAGPSALDKHQRQGPIASHHIPPSERNQIQQPPLASRLSLNRRAGESQQLTSNMETTVRGVYDLALNDRDDLPKYYMKRSPSPHDRPLGSMTDTMTSQRSTSLSSYREGPPPRSYPDDRRVSDAGLRRPPPPPPPPHHYAPPADSAPSYHPQSIPERREVDRREEPRQWRERPDNYPSYGSQADPERGGRRFSDTRGLTRGHPPPPPPPPPPPSAGPTSWDRDKDKDKDYAPPQPWMKYPPRGSSPPLRAGSMPPRWEAPPPQPPPQPAPAMHSQPASHRPLQARLGDTYDQRFVPRDAVDHRDRFTGRPPPPPPSQPSMDAPMRDTYRSDNPRLRPRSPSPMNRPMQGGTYDDGPRPLKRARDEYDIPSSHHPHPHPHPHPHSHPPRSGPYYDEGRRGSEPDPYASRMPPPPPPPSFYDHRHGPGVNMNPRDPPYPRDRVSDQYGRRDAPPPPPQQQQQQQQPPPSSSRSPTFYHPQRDRYTPR